MRPRRTMVMTLAAWSLAAAAAFAQMPDARQMSGIPMPAGDMPAGTVVVRLVRGSLADNIAGFPVDLQIGDKSVTVKTDDGGHAEFTGVTPGVPVRALTVVAGERLESQTFQLTGSGGMRVILTATAGAAAGAPAVAGDVIFGGDSRIQVEFDDDTLTVFYLFQIVNAGTAPISPTSELVFELPEGAGQPTLLEGSTTQATVRGRHVSIAGPFAPGVTPVQIGFELAPGGSSRTLTQVLPAVWAQPQVIVSSVPGLTVTSPQLSATRNLAGDSRAFVMGTGPMLAAGKELTVTLEGVPSRNRAGRMLALALALMVLAAGAWSAGTARSATGATARRSQLQERRSKLMTELVRLEQQQRGGTIDPGRYQARRGDLMDQLERIYGELDQHGGPLDEGQVA